MIAHRKASDFDLLAAGSTDVAAEGAQAHGLKKLLAGVMDRFRAARAARSTYDQLSQLSDRELADIGLHRFDLPDLVQKGQFSQR